MSDFIPFPQQAEAIAAIKGWFRNRAKEQQVFRVFGYAGTGKSTIVKHAIDELGLDENDVLYAAFTGKAALVMTRKGTPASTIHSLIYRVSDASEQELRRLEQEIAEIRASLFRLGTAERLFAETRLRSLELRLKDKRKPSFVLNGESALRDARLLVLDEVSMVSRELARDLLSFGKPALVLGDPGQLPPVRGEGAFNDGEPDILLAEVHRQAKDSAIIRLATWAREGVDIPYGQHDEFVWKMNRHKVGARNLLNAGQVICGKNATRIVLNNAMKEASGFGHRYPTGRGEKIICLKNRNDLGIVNGMFLELHDVSDDGDRDTFTARLTTEDGVEIGASLIGAKAAQSFSFYKGYFDEHAEKDNGRIESDYFKRRSLIETTWGWAITCHRAQGSQYENVVVADDGWGGSKLDRARWLYTAITRAEKGLVILD